MIDKLDTYRLSGVSEYWIIDLKQENILNYSFDNYEIDQYKVFRKGETARSLAFKSLTCDTDQLFSDLI